MTVIDETRPSVELTFKVGSDMTPAGARLRLDEIRKAFNRLAVEQAALVDFLVAGQDVVAQSCGLPDEMMTRLHRERSKPKPRLRPPPSKMRLADVLAKTGVTKRTIYRWMDDPVMAFPRPTFERGVALWDEIAVDFWWVAHEEKTGRWPAT